MKLSVIITVYNREATLKRCVDSVLRQDLKDYEILLVDDGSSDGSRRLMEEYEAGGQGRVRCLYRENQGVAGARNAGLSAAKGEYVTYVDSDDYLEENCFGRLYTHVKKYQPDILLFDGWEEKPDGSKNLFPPFYDCMAGTPAGILGIDEYLLARPCPWNQWTRRSLFAEVFSGEAVFPPGKIYEDLGTMPCLGLKAERVLYLAEPVYHYVQSPGSIMRTAEYRPGFADIFPMCQRLYDRLGTRFPTETEYLYYEHLLISGGRRFLDCNRRELAADVADCMRELWPKWRKNPYVKRESLKKRFFAKLIYKKRFGLLKQLRR